MNRRNYILVVGVLAGALIAAVAAIIALTHRSPTATSADTTPSVATTATASTAAGSPTTEQPATSTPAEPDVTAERAGPAPIDPARQRDINTVALTAIATLRSFDAAADPTQVTSAQRAAYLLAPDLAATLTREPEDGASGEWQAWAHNRTWASVTVARTELPWALPADTDTSATRVVLVNRALHDGIRTTTQTPETLQLTLTRSSAQTGWRVTTIEVP